MLHASACSFLSCQASAGCWAAKTALGLRSSFVSKECVTLPHASMGRTVRYQAYQGWGLQSSSAAPKLLSNYRREKAPAERDA